MAPLAFHVYLSEGKARGANPQTLTAITYDHKFGDSMDTSKYYVTIIESSFTVSGLVICFIESTKGVLKTGAKLIAPNGDEWTIVESDVSVRGLKHEHIVSGLWRLYRLEFKHGGQHKPDQDAKLLVINNGS